MKAKSTTRDVATLSLLSLESLKAHPRLVPLRERHEGLLKRQESLAQAIDGARLAADRLEAEAGAALAQTATPESWAPSPDLTAAQARIVALETEQRIVGHALTRLREDLADAEDDARAELSALYTREAAGHVDRVVEALDQAIQAWSGLTATIMQGQRVLGVGAVQGLEQIAQHPLAQLREILVMRRQQMNV
jgi:hypothetical protein